MPNDLEEGERGNTLGWLQLADGGLLRTLFLSQLAVALLRSRPLLCPNARKRKEEDKKEEDGMWAPHEPHHFLLLFSVTNNWAPLFLFFWIELPRKHHVNDTSDGDLVIGAM